MMFMSKTEIQDHIEDRTGNWYDELVNMGMVSDELLSEAIANDGELEIGYDFGTLSIDNEGYVVDWEPLNDAWNED